MEVMIEATISFGDNVDSVIKEAMDYMHTTYVNMLNEDIGLRLDNHVEEVTQQNKGKVSNASCTTLTRRDVFSFEINSSASFRLIRHEYGHAVLDALGLGTSNESARRANGIRRRQHKHWPRFSFGNADGPREKFMLSLYGNKENIPTTPLTDIDTETCMNRFDLFKVSSDNGITWMITDVTKPEQWGENRLYITPINDTGTCIVKGTGHGYETTNRHSINVEDIELVSRFHLTPGLATCLGNKTQEPAWETPLEQFIYELNTTWHEAAIKIRKRDERREQAKQLVPKQSAYYLANCHEYFAELFAMATKQRCVDNKDVYESTNDSNPPEIISAYIERKTLLGNIPYDDFSSTVPGIVELFERAFMR